VTRTERGSQHGNGGEGRESEPVSVSTGHRENPPWKVGKSGSSSIVGHDVAESKSVPLRGGSRGVAGQVIRVGEGSGLQPGCGGGWLHLRVSIPKSSAVASRKWGQTANSSLGRVRLGQTDTTVGVAEMFRQMFAEQRLNSCAALATTAQRRQHIEPHRV